MKILYAASECLPYISTGGLADVVGSLPQAVKKALGDGHDVRVVIPLYPSIREKFAEHIYLVAELVVKLSWRGQYCGIWKTERDGVVFYFIDNLYYFDRGTLYGNFDDAERFAFFSKAILELMSAVNFFPDVLHANDWQTALSVIYLKRKYSHLEQYKSIRALFTIHNIDYQGVYDFSILADVFELAEWDRGVVEYNGCINLLKGAIQCADMVSTVSRTYSREILTEYYASGLHHVLRQADAEGKLTGIVNGIDVDYYNCATDSEIPANFSSDDLSGKVVCKAELQRMCGLEQRDVPMIAMISRLAAHKGFDLVRRVLDELVGYYDIQVVLLGTGERELEDYFKGLEHRFPNKVKVMLEYNKALSKKIYAGADMFLMPSKSEPCGLAQMISSRYGTVPIVRECGGLADTIVPYNEYSGIGNGFSFKNYNAHDMKATVEYALELYGNKDTWKHIVENTLAVDFSWNVSAEQYIGLYKKITNR